MLKLKDQFHFSQSFKNLPRETYEEVGPTPIRNPRLIHFTKLKNTLGLDELSDDELVSWLNGTQKLDGDQRISTRYAGHQFGVWAGQLGDGRAISLGEIMTPLGDRLEIQTKGSGLTPFSRMGDGKAVIRSSVREYLCSEAMYGLNIPTTRVLALMTGEDDVQRETVEKSALIARVFPSNLRFGHFEMFFHSDQQEILKALITYSREYFFNNVKTEEMLQMVVERTAKLMAQWQSVGFCHGVMNTDNMSILGITIDYGPFGFLEDTILNYVCNHSDHHGRYAYNQQPSVAMWNLERFLICFKDELPLETLRGILNSYPDIFEKEYLNLSRQKLGLLQEENSDYALFAELLKNLHGTSMDYTFFFRQLSSYRSGEKESLKEIWDYYGNREEIIQWLGKYNDRLKQENSQDEERHKRMKAVNPKYVLKNYIAQEVIEDVEKGSSEKLEKWREVFYHPYDEHPNFEEYSKPTKPELKNIEVSCSS